MLPSYVDDTETLEAAPQDEPLLGEAWACVEPPAATRNLMNFDDI